MQTKHRLVSFLFLFESAFYSVCLFVHHKLNYTIRILSNFICLLDFGRSFQRRAFFLLLAVPVLLLLCRLLAA